MGQPFCFWVILNYYALPGIIICFIDTNIIGLANTTQIHIGTRLSWYNKSWSFFFTQLILLRECGSNAHIQGEFDCYHGRYSYFKKYTRNESAYYLGIEPWTNTSWDLVHTTIEPMVGSSIDTTIYFCIVNLKVEEDAILSGGTGMWNEQK